MQNSWKIRLTAAQKRRFIFLALAAMVIGYWQLPAQASIKVWGAILTDMAYAQAETWLGSQIVLHQRAVNAQGQLEGEIDRLRWLEAESEVRAGTMATTAAELQLQKQQMDSAQRELSELASGTVVDKVWQGQPVSEQQINQLASEAAKSRDALQIQLELSYQINALYTEAAQNARAVRLEMQQNAQAMQVYMDMLEATRLVGEVQGDSFTNRDTVDVADALRDQIDRNRRLIEQRRSLDALLTQPVFDPVAD